MIPFSISHTLADAAIVVVLVPILLHLPFCLKLRARMNQNDSCIAHTQIQQRVPMPFNKNEEGENVRCVRVFVDIANDHNYTRQIENKVHLKKGGSERKKTTYFPLLAHSQ